jgi:DNA-binding CsgD family transcriptional regulator
MSRKTETPAKGKTDMDGAISNVLDGGLTLRESEILGLMAEGLTNKEIAQKASISAGTVRIHLEHIFKKLHVRSRTEAAARYFHFRTK